MHTRTVPPGASRRLTGTFRRATPLPFRTLGWATRFSPTSILVLSHFPCRLHRSRTRSPSATVHTSACGIGTGSRDPNGGLTTFLTKSGPAAAWSSGSHYLFIDGEYDASHRLESGPPRRHHREVPIPTLHRHRGSPPTVPPLFAVFAEGSSTSLFSLTVALLTSLLSALFVATFFHPHLSLMRSISFDRLVSRPGPSVPARPESRYESLQ
jgi:hypothetical protein